MKLFRKFLKVYVTSLTPLLIFYALFLCSEKFCSAVKIIENSPTFFFVHHKAKGLSALDTSKHACKCVLKNNRTCPKIDRSQIDVHSSRVETKNKCSRNKFCFKLYHQFSKMRLNKFDTPKIFSKT